MKIILFLLLTIYTASAITWSTYTGATGTADTCPPTAGEALMESNEKRLLSCDADTLRKYYNENDCCIVNLANCNYIERAWWMRVNVLKHNSLCTYGALKTALRHSNLEEIALT